MNKKMSEKKKKMNRSDNNLLCLKSRMNTKMTEKKKKMNRFDNNLLCLKSRMNTKMTEKKKKMNRSDNNLYLPQEIVIDHILTKLSVKTLMRFKVVCKLWYNTIKHDSYFADLHYAHTSSRSTQHFLITFPTTPDKYVPHSVQNTVLVDHEGKKPANLIELPLSIIHSSLHGLVVYYTHVDKKYHVSNISTKQTFTFPPLITKLSKPGKYSVQNHLELGYDRIAKQHKVLHLCLVYCHGSFPPFYSNCYIMTLGCDNPKCSWRKLEVVPPYGIEFWYKIYMNGIINWRNRSNFSNKDEVIVTFDFIYEKFSVIPLPESIVHRIAQRPISGCVTHNILCTTMEGHLAITNSEVGISEPLIFWILKDSAKQVWIKKTFSRPFYMNQDRCRAIGTLPTGEVIIKPATNSHQCWLYYYDVMNNTSRKVEFTGLPSQEYYPGVRSGYNVLYNGFVESLYF